MSRTFVSYSALALVTLLLLSIAPSSSLSQAFAATQWTQRGGDIPGEAAGDESGVAVSSNSDGTIVAIGAHKNQGTGTDGGHVRVWAYSAGSWTQRGGDINAEAANDFFGSSLSLSSDGTWLAVGAPGNDGTASNAGHVRVFRWIANAWSQQGGDIDGESGSDASGTSVALSGDGTTVVIGAYLNAGGGLARGSARVYEWNSGTSAWDKVGGDLDGSATADRAGEAVAINSSGDIVAIGARQNDDNGVDAGHVRVYSTDGTTWSLVGSALQGEAAGDYFGDSVSLNSDGTRLAVGAKLNSIGGTAAAAGHVRVFDFGAGSWSQLGSDIDGAAAGDEFGTSVSLNDAGTRFIAGSPQTSAGSARVFELSGSTWSQLGSDLVGDAAGDTAGQSVAMSANGTAVIIGAYLNDDGGADAGEASVFTYEAEVSVTASSEAGVPGIYLYVAGPLGRSAQGSPVYYGSDRVAVASTYVLTVTSVSNPTHPVFVLAQGIVDAQGNLEATATLPGLAPGSYDVALSGQHLSGIGLKLTARITIGSAGTFTALSPNTSSIYG